MWEYAIFESNYFSVNNIHVQSGTLFNGTRLLQTPSTSRYLLLTQHQIMDFSNILVQEVGCFNTSYCLMFALPPMLAITQTREHGVIRVQNFTVNRIN